MKCRFSQLACLGAAFLSFPLKAETTLPKEHPLVGLWHINLPEQNCSEIYDIRTDGTVATNYMVMHVSGAKFMMCQKAELDTCFGPFLKEEGI
jgi:hypothetical protein